MVEKRIVEQCAPTLAGIKCGSLFRTTCDINAISSEIQLVNGLLNSYGVEVTTFRPSGCGTLVYVYRKDLLSRIEKDDERSIPFLEKSGYDVSSTDSLVNSLKDRTESAGCVPHEIGLFLGYPFDDVKGFINSKGKCSKCIGCWKVYGSVETANRLFDMFHRCRAIYTELYRNGASITSLTVPA